MNPSWRVGTLALLLALAPAVATAAEAASATAVGAASAAAALPPAFEDIDDVPMPDPDLWQRIRKGS